MKGIGYYYAAACVCQALWSAVAISSERMITSLVLVLAILVAILALVRSSSRCAPPPLYFIRLPAILDGTPQTMKIVRFVSKKYATSLLLPSSRLCSP